MKIHLKNIKIADPKSTRNPFPPVVFRYTAQGNRKAYFTYSDGTYEEEYSCWPPAVCMILISLVEIVLFCYDAAQGKTKANGPMAMLFIYDPNKRQEAWRFITYMLVHVGYVDFTNARYFNTSIFILCTFNVIAALISSDVK